MTHAAAGRPREAAGSPPTLCRVTATAPGEIVHQLLDHACDLNFSDLFLCAEEDHVAVSGRQLGVLVPVCRLEADLGTRCKAHVKSAAGLDITERRRPQDGRWLLTRAGGHVIDLRVGSIPTLHGEDLSLRLLDRQSRLLTLDQLGLLQHDYNLLLKMLNSSSGLILVTGPTGAGKTTTLYAVLSSLNNGRRKINTIEDPIEYALPGIRQSQVNPRLHVGFAELLRSVMRQAPDVIMIGEIRDTETADIAVRAANSGHLVLATLHAPVAAGAVQSMLGLGVHPHHLASSLLGVLAQRLLRTLEPATRLAVDVSGNPAMFEEVQAWLEPGQGSFIWGPGGGGLDGVGYAGRTGLFETLPVSPAIRNLILERQPLQTIRARAIEEGLIEFRKSALIKVARGETSIEEVFRTIPSEYLTES